MYLWRSRVLPVVLIYELLTCGFLSAAEKQSISDPLNLQQALALIDEQHPALLQDKLLLEQVQNTANEASEHNSLHVDLNGRMRWYEAGSSQFDTGDHDDHNLRLIVSKPLYDGGYSDALSESAWQNRKAARLRITDNRSLYTIMVMQKFFAIILADIEAARENESMAIAFVTFNRGQDNHELGKISDVDLLAMENTFHESRLRVIESEGRARSTRQALALALNRPGQQPSVLSWPELDVNNRKLLEFNILIEKAL